MTQKTTAGYTFMSKSTAKPGRLDDLVRIATAPPAAMDAATDGVIGYQVAVDRDRNTVMVWTTCTQRSVVYDYLASDAAKDQHGEAEDMEAIIETFEMYDMTPVAQRLPG